MRDLISEVENLRQSKRMSQAEVARQMGVSQGQYSKVIARRVPLAAKMTVRMRSWLEQHESTVASLDHDIREKCIELMHLLRARLEDPKEAGERLN